MKNIKFNKKFLSMLTAGMLFATPVAANTNAKAEDAKQNTKYTFVVQEKKADPMTLDKMAEGLGESVNYLKGFKDFDHLELNTQCLYFLVNIGYIPVELENELIDMGVVFETNTSERKMENFYYAYKLIGDICNHNEITIAKQYKAMKKNGTKMDITKLIDPSVFCYDKHDKELVHDMFVNWFNAYKLGRFDNETYRTLFKQLTTLNTTTGVGNAVELSVGANWIARQIVGRDTVEMLNADLLDDFKTTELAKYFVAKELNKEQVVPRDDVVIEQQDCLSELEVEVLERGAIDTVVNTNSFNDLMRYFSTRCGSKTK